MSEIVPVKRMAVILEMENGDTLAVYAQPDPANNDVEVSIKTDQPTVRQEWAPGAEGRTVPSGPPLHGIHVDGLHEYRATENMPAIINAILDTIRNAVNL